MKPALASAAFILIALTSIDFAEAEVGDCSGFGRDLLADFSTEISAETKTSFFYKYFCKDETSSSSSSESLAIGLLLEEFPIKADGNGRRSKEEVERWCDEHREFEDTSRLNVKLTSTILPLMGEVLRECVAASAFGLAVHTRISPDMMVMDITLTNRTTDRSLSLYRPLVFGEATCKLASGAFDDEGKISLPLSRAVTVHCERKHSAPAEVSAATITISTDFPRPIQLHFPALAQVPIRSEEWLDLEAKLAATTVRLELVQEVSTQATKRSRPGLSDPVVADLCSLSTVSSYGGASKTCSIVGSRETGWILQATAREATSTCSMRCYDLVVSFTNH